MAPRKAPRKTARKPTVQDEAIFKKKPEPKIKWQKSQAKKLLYKDIREGRVPLESQHLDPDGIHIRSIYISRDEFMLYSYPSFSGRLSSLRKTIKESNERAEIDKKAFDDFKSRHLPSLQSSMGYAQWQGSEAQQQLKQDLKDKLHLTMSKSDLFFSRECYWAGFPLSAFRDKLYQEIRTSKFLHTLKEKGRGYHKSNKK